VGEGGSAVTKVYSTANLAAETDEVVFSSFFLTTSSVTPPYLFCYCFYTGGATASPTGEASLFNSPPLFCYFFIFSSVKPINR
jgi:hypothetical protein